jgi:hypothetical protein
MTLRPCATLKSAQTSCISALRLFRSLRLVFCVCSNTLLLFHQFSLDSLTLLNGTGLSGSNRWQSGASTLLYVNRCLENPHRLFSYQSVTSSNSMRLRRVFAARMNQSLRVFKRESNPDVVYSYLSHMWTDQSERREIQVNNQTVSVSQNLYDLINVANQIFPLQALCLVDLCINKLDVEWSNITTRMFFSAPRQAHH